MLNLASFWVFFEIDLLDGTQYQRNPQKTHLQVSLVLPTK